MKNKLRNKYKNSLAVICVLGLSTFSCSDLEDKALDKLTDASSIAPEQQLLSAYNQLGSFTDQANAFALQTHSTDIMQGPTRGTDWDDNGRWRNIHTQTWNTLHPDVTGAWDNLNRGVALSNEAINNSGNNGSVKSQAIFLRAWFMSQIVDLFGQVPFKEKAQDSDEVTSTVLSRSEAVDRVISDLKDAISGLEVSTGVNSGKATQEAAKALLAKMYLNRAVYKQDPSNPAGPFNFEAADMDMVIKYCDEIMKSGKFELNANYFDNFSPNNTEASKELIFAILNDPGQSLNNGSSPRNRYYMTTHYNQNPSGWNGFTTLADFYNSFEKGDVRLGGKVIDSTSSGLRTGFLVGVQYDKDGKELTDRQGAPLNFTVEDFDFRVANETQGGRVIKYSPDFKNIDAPGNDYVFLRYADVVLMKAEAMHRKGDSIGALVLVNQVRKARGLKDASSVTDESLLAERGHELYWEGWRRNDLVRFGKFLDPVSNRPDKSPAFRVVYSIPQKEIEINPLLKQNFGY